jgi:hypothetical protein
MDFERFDYRGDFLVLVVLVPAIILDLSNPSEDKPAGGNALEQTRPAYSLHKILHYYTRNAPSDPPASTHCSSVM